MPIGFSFDFPDTSFVGDASLLPSVSADWPAGFFAAVLTGTVKEHIRKCICNRLQLSPVSAFSMQTCNCSICCLWMLMTYIIICGFCSCDRGLPTQSSNLLIWPEAVYTPLETHLLSIGKLPSCLLFTLTVPVPEIVWDSEVWIFSAGDTLWESKSVNKFHCVKSSATMIWILYNGKFCEPLAVSHPVPLRRKRLLSLWMTRMRSRT